MTTAEVFNDWMKVINLPLLNQTLSRISPNNICPHKEDVFKAFKLCSLKDCKVVFIGQDPYPQKDVATGILFGNKETTKEEDLSPSLQVIKEASIDFTTTHNYPIHFDITLESWAKQGILMLNSALTVEMNKIGSHTQIWRPFISQFIKDLSTYGNYLFVLFGQQAQTFEPYINKNYSHIFKENHPAFYARSNKRMPSDIFYNINRYLKSQNEKEIVWYTEFNEDSI
jgi:uracil-DNA glycosylase